MNRVLRERRRATESAAHALSSQKRRTEASIGRPFSAQRGPDAAEQARQATLLRLEEQQEELEDTLEEVQEKLDGYDEAFEKLDQALEWIAEQKKKGEKKRGSKCEEDSGEASDAMLRKGSVSGNGGIGLDMLKERMTNLEEKQYNFELLSQEHLEAKAVELRGYCDEQVAQDRAQIELIETHADKVKEDIAEAQEAHLAKIEKLLEAKVEEAKGCHLQVWQATRTACRSLEDRMSVLEGSNEAMRFDMASLDAESARQAREELLARLQRISDQVDDHVRHFIENDVRLDDAECCLRDTLGAAVDRISASLDAHGIVPGKAPVGSRLLVAEERLARVLTQMDTCTADAAQTKASTEAALQDVAAAKASTAAALAEQDRQLGGRIHMLEESRAQCEVSVEASLRASQHSSDHARKRCADIEFELRKLQRVQAISAATTRCLVCNPLLPDEGPARAPWCGCAAEELPPRPSRPSSAARRSPSPTQEAAAGAQVARLPSASQLASAWRAATPEMAEHVAARSRAASPTTAFGGRSRAVSPSAVLPSWRRTQSGGAPIDLVATAGLPCREPPAPLRPRRPRTARSRITAG